MKTTHFRALRVALVAAGVAVAAPSFASVVTPLCGGEKDDQQDKNKSSENKKEKEQPKKPTNPA
jgi:hypothetical protein